MLISRVNHEDFGVAFGYGAGAEDGGLGAINGGEFFQVIDVEYRAGAIGSTRGGGDIVKIEIDADSRAISYSVTVIIACPEADIVIKLDNVLAVIADAAVHGGITYWLECGGYGFGVILS